MSSRMMLLLALPVAATCVFLLTMAVRQSRDNPLERRTSVHKSASGELPNHWTVPRHEKDKYLNNTAAVTKQITLKPTPGKLPDSVTDLTIISVDENSPMYEAGFRREDRILMINGAPIETMGRALNLLHEIKASSLLTIQVRRGDRIIDYQVTFE